MFGDPCYFKYRGQKFRNGVLMGRILETTLALLLTATYITTSFGTASKLWQSNQEKQSPEKNTWSVSRSPRAGNSFNNVFYPQKCNPNDKNLKACALEDEMNKTACLMIECCFKDRTENSCFHKTIDRPLQVLTILGIGILAVLCVAICPYLCCVVLQKTKVNSLLRKNKDVEDAKLKDMKVGGYVFSLLKKQKERQKLTKGKK
ncbi:uncharacterized protein [Hemitrygon akajei]|uniref:uncharacterized protein n=1 Tax=Hemitrygon akajei TaxID=2704970 RepID=UPI003BF9E2CB